MKNLTTYIFVLLSFFVLNKTKAFNKNTSFQLTIAQLCTEIGPAFSPDGGPYPNKPASCSSAFSESPHLSKHGLVCLSAVPCTKNHTFLLAQNTMIYETKDTPNPKIGKISAQIALGLGSFASGYAALKLNNKWQALQRTLTTVSAKADPNNTGTINLSTDYENYLQAFNTLKEFQPKVRNRNIYAFTSATLLATDLLLLIKPKKKMHILPKTDRVGFNLYYSF
jgi:hypothetical protein